VKSPRFNPLIYSLANDLPQVKFGLDDKWAPDQTYKPDLFVFGRNDLRLSVRLIERLFGLGQFHLLKAILYRDRDLQAF
jgi:hypothetical protein